jgi:hypothetical protein
VALALINLANPAGGGRTKGTSDQALFVRWNNDIVLVPTRRHRGGEPRERRVSLTIEGTKNV